MPARDKRETGGGGLELNGRGLGVGVGFGSDKVTGVAARALVGVEETGTLTAVMGRTNSGESVLRRGQRSFWLVSGGLRGNGKCV